MKDGRNVYIRSARGEDASLLLEYMNILLQDAPYILTSKDTFKVTLQEEILFLEALEKSTSGVMLLALCDGEIVGNADIRSSRYRRTQHRAEFGMSVRQDCRGQGVGKALLKGIITIAKENSLIKKLELGVIEKNQSAIKLYESFGFKEEGRSIKGFCSDDGEYLDEIRMGLFLSSYS